MIATNDSEFSVKQYATMCEAIGQEENPALDEFKSHFIDSIVKELLKTHHTSQKKKIAIAADLALDEFLLKLENSVIPFDKVKSLLIELANQEVVGLRNNFDLNPEEFERLCEEVKQGKESLFKTIYLKYRSKIVLILQKDCKASYEKAEMAVDMAFAVFCKQLRTSTVAFEGLEAFVTKSAKRNFYRDGKVKIKIILPAVMPAPALPAVLLFGNPQLADMAEAFAHLCNRCQKVLRLNAKGYKFKEIKDMMGFPTENAATHAAYECRKKLMNIYKNL